MGTCASSSLLPRLRVKFARTSHLFADSFDKSSIIYSIYFIILSVRAFHCSCCTYVCGRYHGGYSLSHGKGGNPRRRCGECQALATQTLGVDLRRHLIPHSTTTLNASKLVIKLVERKEVHTSSDSKRGERWNIQTHITY
jgi:hypothetical protein